MYLVGRRGNTVRKSIIGEPDCSSGTSLSDDTQDNGSCSYVRCKRRLHIIGQSAAWVNFIMSLWIVNFNETKYPCTEFYGRVAISLYSFWSTANTNEVQTVPLSNFEFTQFRNNWLKKLSKLEWYFWVPRKIFPSVNECQMKYRLSPFRILNLHSFVTNDYEKKIVNFEMAFLSSTQNFS